MAETATVLAKVTRKGQMTIPLEFRENLDIRPGDYVALRPLMGGFLVSKATITPQVRAEDILQSLVVSLGQAAEQQGIHDEKDLDAVIEDIQGRAYQERYGQ
jgi:AbrB family looped-hinge helix DNA binding protein